MRRTTRTRASDDLMYVPEGATLNGGNVLQGALVGAAIGAATGAIGGGFAAHLRETAGLALAAAGAGGAYASGGLEGLANFGAGMAGAMVGAYGVGYAAKNWGKWFPSQGAVGESGVTTWQQGGLRETPNISPRMEARMREALYTHITNKMEQCFKVDLIDGNEVLRAGNSISATKCEVPLDNYDSLYDWHTHRDTAVPSYTDQTSFNKHSSGPTVIYSRDGITVIDPSVKRWDWIKKFD